MTFADRGLRPAAELYVDRPHGTRLRYLAGCKCFHCRRANGDYNRARQAAIAAGDWNGIVPATRARLHLQRLSRKGVGRRAVAAVTDLSETILFGIRTGTQSHIRARTERKILAVTTAALSDRALVAAGPTWQFINQLVEEGYTKTFIAKQLGYARAIQLNKEKVTVKNAAKVERLHRRLTS